MKIFFNLSTLLFLCLGTLWAKFETSSISGTGFLKNPTDIFDPSVGVDKRTVSASDFFDGSYTEPLQVNVIKVTPQGCDLNTGAIDIEVFGGTPPYAYNWIAFANTEDISGLNARNYQLEVADANGAKTNRLTIAVPKECGCDNITKGGKIGLDPNCESSTTVCIGENNIVIGNCELPSGGNGTIQYLWLKSIVCPNRPPAGIPNDPDWVIVANSDTPILTISNLSQTTCYIRCARRSGCEDYLGESNIFKIEVDQNPKVWYADTDLDTYGDPNNSLVACEHPPGYVPNAGDCDDSNSRIPAAPGTTCSDGDPTTVNDKIQADGCTCKGEDQPLICPTVEIKPGVGGVTVTGLTSPKVILGIFQGLTTVYACNNNCEDGKFIPLPPNDYRILIQFRDQNNHRILGCENVFKAFIIEEQCIDKDKDGYCVDQDCNDDNPNIPTTPGTDCDDGNSNTINDKVTSDGCGCIGTPIPTCELMVELANKIDPGCSDRNDGIVAIRVSKGQEPYEYNWSNGKTGVAGITQLTAGDYTVSVIDANGCQVIKTYNLKAPDPIEVTETITPSTCGQTNGTIVLAVSGGNGDYKYFWNSTPSTASQTNLAAGTYSVIIRDKENCEAVDTYIVENYTSDCGGGGELQPTRCDFEVRYSDNNIQIDGNVASVVIFKGYKESENVFFTCQGDCPTSKVVANIPPGDYGVKIFNHNYSCVFDKRFVAKEGGGSTCTDAGWPCDDGNDCTVGDVFDANCNCVSGTVQDVDGDGVCDIDDICPNGDDTIDTDGDGTPDACDTINGCTDVGKPCDDDNPNTTNDVILADDCSCAGTPVNNGEPDCTAVTATSGRGTITVDGLTSPIEHVKVYKVGRGGSWTQVASCAGDCGDTWVAEGLVVGDYVVQFTLRNSSWRSICDNNEENISLYIMVTEGAASGRNNLADFTTETSVATTLKIYPNPAQEIITLDMSNWVNKSVTITIRNHFSQLVDEQDIGQVQMTQQIDLTTFANGLYYIQVQGTDGTQSVVQKLIVNRLY